MTNLPFHDIPNEALFLQTFAVLELLQHREPNPERADILQRLGPVRNHLIHRHMHGSRPDPKDVDTALADVLQYLRQLEMTSLGTPEAQRVRQRVEPGVIVEALLRSSTSPARRHGSMAKPDVLMREQQVLNRAEPAVGATRLSAQADPAHAYDYHRANAFKEDDEALVVQAQAGDHGAFDELYTRHYSYSWRVAYKMVFHRQDADDLAQAIWAKVYTGLHTFKPDARFLPWLHGTTVHTVIDHFRRQQRRPERLVDHVDLMALPSTTVSEPAANIVANEDVVRRALSRLRPDLYREVLVLADMLDMHPADIAKQLGLKAGQVNGVLHRARKKFTALVARELDGPTGDE